MARVLVIGDTHAPYMDKRYPKFLTSIQQQWQTNRTVMIGDLVDWSSISFHNPKAPALKNSEREFADAMEQVQEIYSRFPKADWLVGNHDALTERQALDVGLPSVVLRDYAKLWDVPRWEVYPRYHDLIIDDVIYRHGDKGKGGAMPAFANAQSEFMSVVQGHFHAVGGMMFGANKRTRYFGLQVGCGINETKAAFQYSKKFARRPVLGCGVVIDGVPVFEPMPI